MLELTALPTLTEVRARLADEDLVCPPGVALFIARELTRALAQCFEHGLCPAVIPLSSIQVSSLGEICVRPGDPLASSERDAVVAMAHALTAFSSASPVLEAITRTLYVENTFAGARERIERHADKLGVMLEVNALVRLLSYLDTQPNRTLKELPLFERAPSLDFDIAVHEPGRAALPPPRPQEDSDPNAWFLRVIPKAMRHAPAAERVAKR
jgi:hypothetical protein